MSSYKAIGAVTKALTFLISNKINSRLSISADVKSEYPEKFYNSNSNAINVHLYHVKENGNLKNSFSPMRNKQGARSGVSYLSVDLYYMVSTRSEEEYNNDLMLGYAMLSLNDNPILDKDFFSLFIEKPPFDGAEISKDNFESIKISMANLTLDEASKVWSMYGVKYRPCAYYKVSVVLLRERHEYPAGLPVKERIISVQPFKKIEITSIEKD